LLNKKLEGRELGIMVVDGVVVMGDDELYKDDSGYNLDN